MSNKKLIMKTVKNQKNSLMEGSFALPHINNELSLNQNQLLFSNNILNMISFKSPIDLKKKEAFLKLDYEYYLPMFCKAD